MSQSRGRRTRRPRFSLFARRTAGRRRSQLTFLVFFLPAAIFILVLVVYPIVDTLALSFLTPGGQSAGLQNYGAVLVSQAAINPDCGQPAEAC